MTFWDEKKFNLDGSDCLVRYSYDLQRESPCSPKQNFGSFFFLVNFCFSAFCKTTSAFACTRMNSHFLSHSRRFPLGTFMRHNATVYVPGNSRLAVTARKKNQTSLILIIPIENPWSQLMRDVYDNCRQLNTVTEI